MINCSYCLKFLRFPYIFQCLSIRGSVIDSCECKKQRGKIVGSYGLRMRCRPFRQFVQDLRVLVTQHPKRSDDRTENCRICVGFYSGNKIATYFLQQYLCTIVSQTLNSIFSECFFIVILID